VAGRQKNPDMLDAVERAMARGVSFRDILAACEAKWHVSEATVARYCSHIRKRWAREEEELRPERRAEFRAMLRDAWQMARENKQGMALASLARVLASLDGLNQPAQLQVAIAGQVDIRAMTPGERREEIDRLIALRREAMDGTAAGPPQLPAHPPGNGRGNGHGNGHGGNGHG